MLIMPSSRWSWIFMGTTLFQCIVALALEGYVFGKFQASLLHKAREDVDGQGPLSGALTIPTYLALFIFGFLYELVLVWDALRLKNTIQVIGICMYNLGMLIYAAVEMSQVDDAIHSLQSGDAIKPLTWNSLRPYLIATPCLIALCSVIMSFVAWKLYDEFAWTIYKQISADLRLKRRFLTYQVHSCHPRHHWHMLTLISQIYIALLKFDFFFFLGFTVQFLVIVQDTTDVEFWLTVAAIPVTIILLFFAAFFIRRESYVGQTAIITVYFGGAAYFIFKLVRMYDYASSSVRFEDYKPARKMLTTFAVLTLLLLATTITTAFVCMKNFKKGLRPHIQQRAVPSANELKYSNYGPSQFDAPPNSSHQLGAVPSRMVID